MSTHYDNHARMRWTPQRIARLGFLAGQGWCAKQIANELGTSAYNIYRMGNRFEVLFMSNKRFDLAAVKRGITRGTLVARVLQELASDSNLIENVLDDGR